MTLKKIVKSSAKKTKNGKKLNGTAARENTHRGAVKMSSLLLTLIIIAILALGALIYLLFPQYFTPAPKASKQNSASSSPVTITYMTNQVLKDEGDGSITRLDNIINNFTKQTGIKVVRIRPPQSVGNYSDISVYLKNILQSNQPQFDVTMVDSPWTGMFAPYMLDLTPYFKNRINEFFPDLIANATINGKLVAMPYFQDMTVLFYRTDLLEKYGYKNPPQTWDELESMAKVIQAGERKRHSNFWGYVWAADESESLTCTALGLQASYGGGTIIDNGKVTVNNPETAKALEKAVGWIGTISPANILQSNEDDIQSAWNIGNVAFMQNWPDSYQVSVDSMINGLYDIAALPSGGYKHSGVYGGEYLGIDKRTSHPKEAAMFLQYMSSPAVQKERAIEDVWSPVLPALYSDPDLAKAQPLYKVIDSNIFSEGVARPGSQVKNIYDSVSEIYFSNIHAILTKEIDVADGLKKLEKAMVDLTGLPSANK